MKTLHKLILLGGVFACAAGPASGKIVISFDYSLDTNGFFGATEKAALQRAAQVYTDRIVDTLTPITSGGGNSFSVQIHHPSSTVTDFNPGLTGVDANVIKIYVGARDLTSPDVAQSGSGTIKATGSTTFIDNANSRGQAGALTATKTDYGPWGGSISFDLNTQWNFAATGGFTASKMDFISVATHEIGHLLGFSSNQPSYTALVSSGKFNGAKATAANGGVAPSVSGSHWVNMTSTVGPGGVAQVPLMDGGLGTGVRRKITQLDWAALDDIGWTLAIPGDLNADGVVDFVDFQTFELNFGKTNARWSDGDFNEDGVVNTADFRLLHNNFGLSAGAPEFGGSVAAVPEPSSIILAVGTAFLLRRRR